MASSRARPRKADPDSSPLLQSVRDALARALDRLRDEAAQSSQPMKRTPARRGEVVVVALSGGRDSMALLDAAARLARVRGSGIRRLLAVHVHHGLSPHADDWLAHCEAECAARDVELVARRVDVRRRGRGLEAAAREARYGALAQAARDAGARIVLTAHHREDRLETFLIQWLRGAGVDGLAAFPPSRSFVGDLLLVRPFVDVARSEIEQYLAASGIPHVEDESNDEHALLRNALRADVLPRLDALRPGFRAAAARSIDLVAEAAEALRSTADDDLAQASDGAPDGMVWLDRITALPLARQTALVRAWLDRAGIESMALIVQKYGGTSVGTVERIKNVAKRVAKWQRAGHRLMVVVSAMAGETNRLIALAKRDPGSRIPDPRELDVIASTGEQVTIGLLSMALKDLGVKARATPAAGARADRQRVHQGAHPAIDEKKIRARPGGGNVVVVAGFQGVDEHGNITTLGRGGSDTSASRSPPR
jgi:tRNA(Ile)-lysidine synthetase-like protein